MESSSRPDWREERYGAFDEALLLAEQHQSSAADEPIDAAVAATGASVASDDGEPAAAARRSRRHILTGVGVLLGALAVVALSVAALAGARDSAAVDTDNAAEGAGDAASPRPRAAAASATTAAAAASSSPYARRRGRSRWESEEMSGWAVGEGHASWAALWATSPFDYDDDETTAATGTGAPDGKPDSEDGTAGADDGVGSDLPWNQAPVTYPTHGGDDGDDDDDGAFADAPGSGATCDVPFDMVSVYKYTVASKNATEDGDFVESWLGCTAGEDTEMVDESCAVADKRGCLQKGGEAFFSLHFVTSQVSVAGNMSVGLWDDIMRSQHGTMKDWDQFMHYKFTFWAPNLDEHAKKFKELGLPHLARKCVVAGRGAIALAACTPPQLALSPRATARELTRAPPRFPSRPDTTTRSTTASGSRSTSRRRTARSSRSSRATTRSTTATRCGTASRPRAPNLAFAG